MDAARPLRDVFRELASGTSEHFRELASGTSEHSRELASGTSEHSRELASGTSGHSRELASGSGEHSEELVRDDGTHAPDPGEMLRVNGHADLPDGLVAEAVTSYADTAAIEVAEHLAPYVMSNSPVPVTDPGATAVDPGSWLDALATVPPAALDAADADPAGLDDVDAVFANDADDAPAPSPDLDLDFDFGGHGAFGAGGVAHQSVDAGLEEPGYDVETGLDDLPELRPHEPAGADSHLDDAEDVEPDVNGDVDFQP